MVRLALGLQYEGSDFSGWQTQLSGNTVQDKLEYALSQFSGNSVMVTAAGRTDTGVHALGQVVHFDTALDRTLFSWVRGTNRFLPNSIAVQWVKPVPDDFHARFSAVQRCYLYALHSGALRAPLLAKRVGYQMLPQDQQLDIGAMRYAASLLKGEHDFSAFRAAACQAKSPIRMLDRLDLESRGSWVFFYFRANAFLHHMVRNMMGCLLEVGRGRRPPEWVGEVLAKGNRQFAAPTFMADGLYLSEVIYPDHFALPIPDLSASLFHGVLG